MASRFQLPPIVKAAERLVVEIEQAVRRFERYHRYAIGTDLRRQAMQVYHLSMRAWRDRAHQARWVDELVVAVDRLKEHLQISKQLRALASFRLFEALWRQVQEIGAQAGGWRRHQMHPNVQNAQGSQAVVQRDQKLSTRATPTGVNP